MNIEAVDLIIRIRALIDTLKEVMESEGEVPKEINRSLWDIVEKLLMLKRYNLKVVE